MYRVLFVVFRKDGISHADFLDHYQNVHVPIARTFPDLRDYRIWPVDGDPEPGAPDAFAVMTFDSETQFATATQSPEFAQAVKDNESFVDRFETYPVGHIEVISAGASHPVH
jgi:uncharacterized protein (TIGR02118 family)